MFLFFFFNGPFFPLFISRSQSCNVCQKNFANVYRLQRHMISHDESAGLRKFKCTYCDKAFKFKHHLKVKTVWLVLMNCISSVLGRWFTGARSDSLWREAVRVRQLRKTFLPLGLVFISHDLQKVPHPQFQGKSTTTKPIRRAFAFHCRLIPNWPRLLNFQKCL